MEEVPSEVSEIAASEADSTEAPVAEPTYEANLKIFWGDTPLEREGWWNKGYCKGGAPNTADKVFYPLGQVGKRGEAYVGGRLMCANCVVQNECLDDALQQKDAYGIWGGLSKRELADVERKLKKDPLAARKLAEQKRVAGRVYAEKKWREMLKAKREQQAQPDQKAS